MGGSTTVSIASISLATVTAWESDQVTIRFSSDITDKATDIVLSFTKWYNPPNTKVLSDINFKIVKVGTATNLCGDEGCIIASYNDKTLTAVSTDDTLTSAEGSIITGQGVVNRAGAEYQFKFTTAAAVTADTVL